MMTRIILSFLIGLVFGSGLYLSGMTSPNKVQGFLDLFGLWDPSLALVMGGAIAVGLVAFQAVGRRTLFGGELRLPRATGIDAPLVLGGLIFGVGWGLSGICPGPGIVDVGFLDPSALIFIAAMTAGMALQKISAGARAAGAPVPEE
ncbi:DUF6691 family protein [Methylosinus sp. RM1]|uniref:DUF6691 family protein n=1 Tax=Methylosinus sp. RM1 TaxID=2583817 RepID=UPI001FEEAB64|nr:DUF6691 family protein [Methylosinus sp. RM1]